MRLTLRTLLAWLDDTLSPGEVREIGQQVSESPFAQELVERIHRVTRQRRLSVPNDEGDEATDPNLVARYLDNEPMEPEAVSEFEKLCLTADVNLAEVASVHQVLSLIGQKAKVPNEARQRMYRLIKGREVTTPRTAAAVAAEPEPAVPWDAPELTRRPWLERFGPALAIAGLIALLSVSAYMSIGPRPAPVAIRTVPKPAPTPEPVKKAPEPAPAPKPAEPAKKAPEPEDAPKDKVEAPEDTAKKADRDVAPPARGVGSVGKGTGVLVRFNTMDQRWETMTAGAALRPDDRIVGLAPFRIPLQLGAVRVELVRDAEVRPRVAEPGQAAHFELVRGRVVVRVEEAGKPIGVVLAKKLLRITPPAETPIGLELVSYVTSADAEPAPALVVYVPEGDVTLAAGGVKEVLSGPGSLQFRPPATFRGKDGQVPPAWVTDPTPSPADRRVGTRFAALFRPGIYPKSALMEATIDKEDRDLRQLALSGLGTIGEIDYVVQVLSTEGDPVIRKAAINVLRIALSQSPESAQETRNALENYKGPDQGEAIEKLLVGYTPKEAARDSAVFTILVKTLESPDVGARELALANLRSLTLRDSLGYDPDKPEGAGLQEWKKLLQEKKLRVAADRPR